MRKDRQAGTVRGRPLVVKLALLAAFTLVLAVVGAGGGGASPTIYLALDEAGEAGIDALMDEELQRLAWENHGFRTEVSGTGADEDHCGVPHLAAEITQVAAMPSYAAMEKIIAALS